MNPAHYKKSPRRIIKDARELLAEGLVLRDPETRVVSRIIGLQALPGKSLMLIYEANCELVKKPLGRRQRGSTAWFTPLLPLFSTAFGEQLIAGPYLVFPDNKIAMPTRARREDGWQLRKNEILARVSTRFNGGTVVKNTWVHGYDCLNIAPAGNRLYTSWGSLHSWMRFIVEPLPLLTNA